MTNLKTYLFLLVVVFSVLGCINEEIKNDLYLENLKGKVKSIREYKFEAVEKFGKIEKGKRVDAHFWSNNSLKTYDTQGRIIEEDEFDFQDNLERKKVFLYNIEGKIIKEDHYNKEGRLTTYTNYNYSNKEAIEIIKYISDGTISEIIIDKLDSYGFTIEKNVFNEQGELENIFKYENDLNGNVTDEYCYKKDGAIDHVTYYSYDGNGNLIEEKGVIENFHFEKIFKYDSKGNIIKEKSYNSFQNIRFENSYKYDKENNEIEHYDENDKISWNSKYTYDSNRNWIHKIEFKDETPLYIIEREITYYD